MDDFPRIIGDVLRRVRVERALTLSDVEARSGGRFKPSSLGGYERGERLISLTRFCELAAVLGIPADRLLQEVLTRAAAQDALQVVINVDALSSLDDEVRVVRDYVKEIRTRRGDHLTDIITLRSSDLGALALASRTDPEALLSKLAPALRAHN